MKPKVVSVEFIMVQKRGVSQVELEFSSISLRVLDGLDRVSLFGTEQRGA